MATNYEGYTPTVVLTVHQRTNRVFRVIRSYDAPEIREGTLARTAIFQLLRAGFVETSEFVGDIYTVLGFVRPVDTTCEEIVE